MYSSFQGIIEEDASQPSSELRSMFPSLHYDDGGFFGDDFWEIAEIGTFENFGQNDDWWVEDEAPGYLVQNPGPNGVRRISGYFYIEQSSLLNQIK